MNNIDFPASAQHARFKRTALFGALFFCSAALVYACVHEEPARLSEPQAAGSSRHGEDHHGDEHHGGAFFQNAAFGSLEAKRHGNLYLTGAPDSAAIDAMKAKGVALIVDLRQPGEDRSGLESAARSAGIAYASVPLFAAGDKAEISRESVEAVTRLHLKYHDAPHVVACASGNRSSAWFAAHVGLEHGDSADAAIAAGRQAFLRDDMEGAVRSFLAKQAR